MMVPLHTGVRTVTVAAEWSLWDIRCRLVVTDPWALHRAREVVEEQLDAVGRVVGARLRRLRRDGGRTPVSELLDRARSVSGAAPVGEPQLGPFPYGIAAAADDTAPGTVAGAAVHDLDGGLPGHHPLRLESVTTIGGWTAQRCAEAVASATRCGVLVSIGGDVATSGLAPVGGWRVRLRGVSAVVALDGGAISAVSLTVGDGGAPRRVLVPATGCCRRSVWREVTVAAANGPAAGAACCGALLRGPAAPGWLAELGLPARLVTVDGQVRRVGRWPA